jgi:hypothetical protein
MKTVIVHYSWTSLYVVIAFILALVVSLILSKYCKRFIKSKLRIIPLLIGTSFLLIAGIGKLGWSAIAWSSDDPAAKLDDNIFYLLSYIGSFFLFLDISSTFFQNDDGTCQKNMSKRSPGEK